MSQYLNMPVLAVGAAFDYYSGLLQEPPQFVQQAGLPRSGASLAAVSLYQHSIRRHVLGPVASRVAPVVG